MNLSKNFFSILFILFFILPISCLKAQIGNLECIGVVMVGESNIMPYKIIINEKDGSVSGYCITDLEGNDETFTEIIGTYDKKNKVLKYNETKILKTSSRTPTTNFCIMNVECRLSKKIGKQYFEGTFTSASPNTNVHCEDGNIIFSSVKVVYETFGKVTKKIKKKGVKDSTQNDILNKLTTNEQITKVNELNKNKKYIHKTESDSVRIKIWDDNLLDGDVIDFYKKVLSDYTITKKPQFYKIPILAYGKNTVCKVVAKSVGQFPPNTVKIQLIGEYSTLLCTNLNIDEIGIFELQKK
jgi:hypothetical protein